MPLNPNKRKLKKSLSFSGPIRIMVISTRGEYCKTVWLSIGIGIAHLMMGATNMAVCIYSIQTGDSHAILCCVGYHLFMAQAILCMHYANGWSNALKIRHRRFAHVFLHVCGLVFACAGTIVICLKKELSSTVHSISGVLVSVFAVLTLMVGLIVLKTRTRYWKMAHVTVGVPTFLLSSICVLAGFGETLFKAWADDGVIYILTAFLVFYSVFVLITAFIKCILKIK